jgi:opacity protein-like surface antigen
MIRSLPRAAALAAAALAFAPPAFAAAADAPVAPWSDWAPFGVERPKWDGRYLAMSTGFEVVSYGRGRTYAGPTIGIEAGQMWREGDVVYGFSGAMNYMKAFGGGSNAQFTEVTRDFAGHARFKLGYLAQPNLLLYTAVGVSAINETWRSPAIVGGGSDTRFAVRPSVSAGFEWQVTNSTRLYGEITASPSVR